MRYAYVKDSFNNKRSIQRQIRELEMYGVDKVIVENNRKNKALKKLIKELNSGDYLFITSISHIGGSKRKNYKILKHFFQNEIILFVKDHKVDLKKYLILNKPKTNFSFYSKFKQTLSNYKNKT